MSGGVASVEAEVLIVGGGPAGSALAAVLAGRGREVLVVDRHHFPRRKACGECLSPGGVALLERLGLREAVQATGPVPLTGWSLVTPRGRSAWAGFPEPLVGWGIDRATFDLALLDEARRRGARVLEGVRVRSVDSGGPSEPAYVRGEQRVEPGLDREVEPRPVEIRASVLVGADGLRSVVARGIGAVARAPRLRKASFTWRVRGAGPERSRGYLLLGGDVTVGLAPAPEAESWNATLVVTARSVRSGASGGALRANGWELLESGLRTLIPEWTAGPFAAGEPVASGPFDRPTRCVHRGRTLLVGDAAGYYDPLTGQGIFRALRSAELAAAAIERALVEGAGAGRVATPRGFDGHAFAGYSVEIGRAFSRGTGVQHAIEAVVTRSILREPAIAAVAWSPAAGRALACLVGDVESYAHDR